MTLKATFVAGLPEVRRISNFLERDYAEEGVIVSLDERDGGDWSAEAYFEDGEAGAIAARLTDWLGADAFGVPLRVEALPETDWIAEGLKSLPPVLAGRFVIHGSHDRDAVPRGRIAIEIDAGQAFGTGHHATTAGTLTVLDRLCAMRRYRRVLDLGTGSGVLAIALAKLTRRPVLATDIDPIAVAVATENAARNGVSPLVRFVTADGLAQAEVRRGAPYDLIAANILAEPLMRLAPALARALAPGGDVVLAGLLTAQRERVVAAYAAQGVRLVRARSFGAWTVLHLARPHGVRGVGRSARMAGRGGGEAWRNDR